MEGIENWKDIANYTNYEVSSFGNVRNKNTGRILKTANKGGYYTIGLSNKVGKTFGVHRLVAESFLPNPEKKLHVNHIDKNSLNNKLENLEWVTCSENNLHNHKIGLITCYKRKISQYDLQMNLIENFNSIKEASIKINIGLGGIKAVLYKKQKTSGGFIFKYLE
jgi:hypothetical protein